MTDTDTKIDYLTDIPASSLQSLSQKSIYFGHQSVGNNIIDGIKELLEKYPDYQLHFQSVDSPNVFDHAAFVHSSLGINGNPQSKCDAFKEALSIGIGAKVDTAFFKFCYVDINENTDVKEIFDYYVTTMDFLKQKYPKIAFIHVTIPLTVIPDDLLTTIKSFVKRIIKKPDWVYSSLVKRNNYNTLLRDKYQGKEPLYDLASLESTWPDGKLQTFSYYGKEYHSLVPLYASDEGHLNPYGQILAAKCLIETLSSINECI